MLDNSIQFLRGIGPKKAEILKQEAGIETVEDLLYYSPRRYIDRSTFKPIIDTFTNEIVTVAGTISRVFINGRRKRYLEVIVDDGTDTISGVFFGGIKYFEKIFSPGDFVLFSGRIDFYRKKQIVHPDFDFIDEDSKIKSINTGRVIPLYRSTERLKGTGFDSRGFRRIIRTALDECAHCINDPVEKSLLDKYNLIPLNQAIINIHYPDSFESAERARRRLAFNEIFFLQFYLALSKKYTRQEYKAEKNDIDDSLLREMLSCLNFALTDDQEKAIDEIKNDLKNPCPMTRMLQGDVGCGKTVVAAGASLLAAGRGDQTAYMAPTEVLVNQHYETFREIMPSGINIAKLTGSTPAREKREIYHKISSGDINIAIGTHALIQECVTFKKLGLIIIDEQHRFGVNQRAKLREKGSSPDLLIMTATPIPRSLSLSLYGDLDISYIREKPADRIPVKTMSFSESRINGVYNSMEKYIEQGRQVFYVLPLIQESERTDLKSANEVFEKLKNSIFSHRRVEILHGRMKTADKTEIMNRFRDNEIDILVSTTAIEVGIDVPNANIMVIHHAERFGLSQLHQLRGRVGRGEHQSFCVLIYPDDISGDGKMRIETVVGIEDGFKIAEEDLKLRGAGELVGTRQHGYNSGFEFTDLAEDIDLIISAREEAESSVKDIADVHGLLADISADRKFSTMLNGIRTKKVLSILS